MMTSSQSYVIKWDTYMSDMICAVTIILKRELGATNKAKNANKVGHVHSIQNSGSNNHFQEGLGAKSRTIILNNKKPNPTIN